MNSDASVVILAAGLGTRMRSRRAKVLHRAGGKMLVEHAVDTALDIAAPGRIFVVVGHQADEVARCMREGLLESPLMPLDESVSIMQTMDTVLGHD